MNDMNFIFDKEFTATYVITGACSLARCGLIMLSTTHLDLQTTIKDLDHFHTNVFTYYYNPHIDYEYEVTPSPTNYYLLKPSKERALVECILHLDWIDEGLLIEGLQTYIDQFYDENKLMQVAEHFHLDKNTLEYWINEAREDYEV